MEQINYVGETLWLGQVGQVFIVLSFVASLIACIGYFAYQQNANKGIIDDQWLRIGRLSFITHSVSVFSIFGLIIYAMLNEMYEYSYVFEHVNEVLPGEYILSAFWEGQEGSFILWMLWHVVLGLILLKRKGRWEAPVLCVLALVEVFLASMILGVYFEIGDFVYKMGSNPLLLIRDVIDDPVFTNAEYLNLIEGRGLNPLLQNYWNVIHPPTTFLGFASTTIPFAFAIAGLWLKEHRSWLLPALRWALFSGAVLGTGILMGSLWAYEALTFGGYWAWDPVENGILVPWLVLIAGIHTNMIARNTKYAIKSTYFMYILTFVLVVYASFLTRSGILGDTSVHAFTNLGLEWQLVAFVSTFLLLGMGLLLYRNKTIIQPTEEEALNSREFWMFIGSLVLLFSGTLIIGSTSLPVYNTIVKVFDPSYVGSVIKDPVPHYDKYQIWIGVFVAILSTLTLYMRYSRGIKLSKLLTKFGIGSAAAVAMTAVTTLWIDLPIWQYKVLAWSGWLAVILNIYYIITVSKGRSSMAASAVSHLGFGLMLIGILASGTNKRHLSSNPFMFSEIISKEEAGKYVRLYKGKPLFANNYWITWQSDTLIDRSRYYEIKMEEVGPDEKIVSSFTVYPTSLLSNDFTKIAALNPDTKHYLHKDIFTNIAALPPSKMDIENYHAMEDSMQWVRYEVQVGDTLDLETAKVYVDKLHYEPEHSEYALRTHDVGVAVDMTIRNKRRSIDTLASVSPALGLEGNLLYRYPAELENFRLRVRLVDSLMDQVFVPEEDLAYEDFSIKRGEAFEYNGYTIELSGLNNKPTANAYEAEEGDIAVAVELTVRKEDLSYRSSPIFIIRNGRPFSIKDVVEDEGLSFRVSGINPQTELFDIKAAQQDRSKITIPIEVAENLPETNYLWFEAREFPGINLFWGGTMLMMIGLCIGWLAKRALKDPA